MSVSSKFVLGILFICSTAAAQLGSVGGNNIVPSKTQQTVIVGDVDYPLPGSPSLVTPQQAQQTAARVAAQLISRYNGFLQHMAIEETGDLAVPQSDGTVLVHFDSSMGRLAEFFLYNIPNADQVVHYGAPRMTLLMGQGGVIGVGGYNFFIRRGPSILCELESTDLENDVFPGFQCEFSISKDGTLRAPFSSKSLNELADSSLQCSVLHIYEGGGDCGGTFKDGVGAKGNSSAYSNFGIRGLHDKPLVASGLSLGYGLKGAAAMAVYNSLSLPATNPPGNGKALVKKGPQIICYNENPNQNPNYDPKNPKDDLPENFYCPLNFSYDGTASPGG